MSRKHEKFSWGGYKYAPESIGFSVYGKTTMELLLAYIGRLKAEF